MASLNILHLTDTHLLASDFELFAGISPNRHLETVLEDVVKTLTCEQITLDAIFCTGDIIHEVKDRNDRIVAYRNFRYYIRRFFPDTPLYIVPGNHDDLTLFRQELADHHTYLVDDDQVRFCSIGQNWEVILVNSKYDQHVGGHWRQCQDEQILNYCAQHPTNYFVALMHHNLFLTNCRWLDSHPYVRRQEFLDSIKDISNLRAVLHGHIHQTDFHIAHEMPIISTPATSVQFLPYSSEFAIDRIDPGYRLLVLKDDGNLEHKLHRVTTNSDYESISGY